MSPLNFRFPLPYTWNPTVVPTVRSDRNDKLVLCISGLISIAAPQNFRLTVASGSSVAATTRTEIRLLNERCRWTCSVSLLMTFSGRWR